MLFQCIYIQTHQVPTSCLFYNYTVIVINSVYSHIYLQLHMLVTQASYRGLCLMFWYTKSQRLCRCDAGNAYSHSAQVHETLCMGICCPLVDFRLNMHALPCIFSLISTANQPLQSQKAMHQQLGLTVLLTYCVTHLLCHLACTWPMPQHDRNTLQ